MTLKLSSKAFENGSSIPKAHTCDGADRSPALEWTAAPAGTRSFALLVEDPDAPAGNWVHWVAYDLPATSRALREGVPPAERIPGGGLQGANGFRKLGYGGPCPPSGKPHRYIFRLYALDLMTDLHPGQSQEVLSRAMEGHILGKAELMGKYQR
jgi:Raf kinase inhibitor-like YbhB/YbcL family protein